MGESLTMRRCVEDEGPRVVNSCHGGTGEGGSIEIDSYFSESLILAQNERWQRGLGMQVERDPEGSNVGR